MFQLKKSSFTVTFVINTLIIKIIQRNIMQTIKGNYVLVNITLVSVKYLLNFTNAENENRYLTDI